jgi:flagellar biosynthesis/type III secretory pathway M-ring protein FliF/YscJ
MPSISQSFKIFFIIIFVIVGLVGFCFAVYNIVKILHRRQQQQQQQQQQNDGQPLEMNRTLDPDANENFDMEGYTEETTIDHTRTSKDDIFPFFGGKCNKNKNKKNKKIKQKNNGKN